jgi:hypothetical protein
MLITRSGIPQAQKVAMGGLPTRIDETWYPAGRRRTRWSADLEAITDQNEPEMSAVPSMIRQNAMA